MDNLRYNWQNFKYLSFLDKLATVILTAVLTVMSIFVGAGATLLIVAASYHAAFPYVIGFAVFVLGGAWAWNRVENKGR